MPIPVASYPLNQDSRKSLYAPSARSIYNFLQLMCLLACSNANCWNPISDESRQSGCALVMASGGEALQQTSQKVVGGLGCLWAVRRAHAHGARRVLLN